MTNEIKKLLTDDAYVDLKAQVINIEGKPPINKDEHVLDYLLRIGENELHDKYLTKHIIHATLVDTLYFIKEALSASSKQRLTVAFALIRKPFVYKLVLHQRSF
jgi:translation initiation factor RLI1